MNACVRVIALGVCVILIISCNASLFGRGATFYLLDKVIFNFTIGGTVSEGKCFYQDRVKRHNPVIWLNSQLSGVLSGLKSETGSLYTHFSYVGNYGYMLRPVAEQENTVAIYLSDAFNSTEEKIIKHAVSAINELIPNLYKVSDARKPNKNIPYGNTENKPYDTYIRNSVGRYTSEIHKANIAGNTTGTFFGLGRCAHIPVNGVVRDIIELEKAVIAIDEEFEGAVLDMDNDDVRIENFKEYCSLVLHELGHSVGMPHTLMENTVMHNGNSDAIMFTTDEANAIRSIYREYDIGNKGIIDWYRSLSRNKLFACTRHIQLPKCNTPLLWLAFT